MDNNIKKENGISPTVVQAGMNHQWSLEWWVDVRTSQKHETLMRIVAALLMLTSKEN